MTDDEIDNISCAKSSTTTTEDETGFEQSAVFIVFAAVIALATVVLLPLVARVIAFVVILKWLKTKIFC